MGQEGYDFFFKPRRTVVFVKSESAYEIVGHTLHLLNCGSCRTYGYVAIYLS